MKKTVFMFSGQGSQYFQMGRELYHTHPRFKLWMDYCDEQVLAMTGSSFIEQLYDEENLLSMPFEQIVHTNPALIAIQFSLSKILIEAGIKPDLLIGYSLGEIVSAIVSGVMSLEEGLKLSIDLANLADNNAEKARMMAIISTREELAAHHDKLGSVWVSGQNFARSLVVSGTKENIESLQGYFGEHRIVCQILAVQYGFHSPLIDNLEAPFKAAASSIFYQKPNIPCVSSFTQSELDTPCEAHYWGVIREPVDFQQTIEQLLKRGTYTFIDLGPSGTLATFVKYILPQHSASEVHAVINQFGKDMQGVDTLKRQLQVA